MDEEDVKKQALDLYKKYYVLFNEEFQFTIGAASVLIKHGMSFYPVPFRSPECIKTLKKVIDLKMPKQRV